MKVRFKPPEMAYSALSRQGQVSGQEGTLLAWNGLQAQVRFESITVTVNPDYLYVETPEAHFPSPDALFREG